MELQQTDLKTALDAAFDARDASKIAELQPQLDRLATELVEVRKTAKEVKQKNAREARANAKNELHRAMFAVADALEGKFASLREDLGESRFDVNLVELIFGIPQQAALGVEHYLCVPLNTINEGKARGVAAIQEEVEANGTATDEECLNYVLTKEAGSDATTFQGGLKRDCDEEGRVLAKRLIGGRGMKLADFVNHPNARQANLTEAHVVALHLYTTAAFRTINNGLRDQARYKEERPHPLPITVSFIKEALGFLRAPAGTSSDGYEMATLYRGMKNMKLQSSFLEEGKGGSELAPMS